MTQPSDDDFDGFYRAHFGDTVGLVYGFTGDLGESQDLAQEAFCRAWRKWSSISAYDDPGAWVRRVAVNLARSRWRRLRTAATYLVHQRTESEPPPDPDHVAVVAALRKLPKAQREAIVLHHLADLPVEEVARQLGAPVGTVKSWLHRGRAALAGELAIDIRAQITTPPVTELVRQAKRHQRVRAITIATALMLAMAGLVAALFQIRPSPPIEPIRPSPSPAPAITIDPSDPILGIDWTQVTISFDQAKAGCPSGQITLPVPGWPRAQARAVTFGDLTGDGRAEAVLSVTCLAGPGVKAPEPDLAVVRRNGDGGIHTLGWFTFPGMSPPWIAGGVLHLEPKPPTFPPARFNVGEVDGYRWTGGRFIKVDTSAAYPPITELDLNPVADQVPCSRGEGALPTIFKDGGAQVGAERLGFGDGPKYVEFGRFGAPYLLLPFSCGPEEQAMVLFDRLGTGWRAIAAFQPPPRRILFPLEVVDRTVTFDVLDLDIGRNTERVGYTWTGSEFIRTLGSGDSNSLPPT